MQSEDLEECGALQSAAASVNSDAGVLLACQRTWVEKTRSGEEQTNLSEEPPRPNTMTITERQPTLEIGMKTSARMSA